MADELTHRSGRPLVAPERRHQIVNAFIELVAEQGLDGVTMDDVAKAAGVQRAAVRHYVGNREDLIAAASEELSRRYEFIAGMGASDAPTIAQLIAMMFGDVATRDHAVEARSWQALLAEERRRPSGRVVVRRAYDPCFDMVESAVRSKCPDAPAVRVRDLAYVIVCLSEQNNVFQRLGYPRARQVAARDAALSLVEDLVAEFGLGAQP